MGRQARARPPAEPFVRRFLLAIDESSAQAKHGSPSAACALASKLDAQPFRGGVSSSQYSCVGILKALIAPMASRAPAQSGEACAATLSRLRGESRSSPTGCRRDRVHLRCWEAEERSDVIFWTHWAT